MSTAWVHRAWPGRVGARAFLTPLGLGVLTLASAACSVDTLQPESRPAVVNSCKANTDCGNGVCTDGACYSRSGEIDEVLLEIVPEATSPFGGVSFLSMQDGLRRGVRNRAIQLSGPVTFPVQVLVNGESLHASCPYLRTGKPSVAARIHFIRTGSVGGVSVAGLSNRFSVTVDTEPNTTGGFSKNVALVPGFYDIYAEPVAYPNCQIAPKLWRGVDVARDGQIVGWAPPATLELPKPITLNGRVTRQWGTLADWQVDVVDPLDEKVISTSAKLGATTDTSPVTNFEINFHPPEHFVTMLGTSSTNNRGATEPLIRLKPPKALASTVPTVYWDLAGLGGVVTAAVNLEVSSLPTPDQLVTVSGQVRGTTGVPVRATVKFLNSTSKQGLSIFGSAVTTDANGNYQAKLFHGEYRVIVIPDGATDDGKAAPGANLAREWALTVRQEIVGLEPTQVLDLAVLPVRFIDGMASAGRSGVVAQGATLEAAPVVARSAGVVRAVIDPAISPARASIPVSDETGKFRLVLDPGDYDISLRPAAASNFAWWILPRVTVFATDVPGHIGTLNPQLFYPVPLEGTITVSMPDKTSQPLRNATVQAYARSPRDSVVTVGITRTDDTGHYYVGLPPDFGSVPAPQPHPQ
jgi:hypothetical protein